MGLHHRPLTRVRALLRRVVVAASALLLALPPIVRATPAEVADAVRTELVRAGAELGAADYAALDRLYAVRAYAPLWIVDGRPNERAHDLATALRNAETHGLDPREYDAAEIAARVAALDHAPATTAAAIARDEVTLGTSAVRFVHDLALGRVDPAGLRFDYDPTGKQSRFETLVDELGGGTPVPTVVAEAVPALRESALLEHQLAHYRTLAADRTLAPVTVKGMLRPGDPFGDGKRLAHWLTALGDLPASSAVSKSHYDGALVEGVQRFQQRHGLAPDGRIGTGTAAALAVPAAKRVRQIELALERLRWWPLLRPDRTIIANIPSFEAIAFDEIGSGHPPALRMAIVTGKTPDNQTPFFARPMTRVVFAPYWNVPTNILKKELLPKIRKNPASIAADQMEIVAEGHVLSGGDAIARLANGTAELRQRPGKKNALGAVKFLFPNPYDVYMHDTPSRTLFERARRDFSHGCIRLAKPAALAHWVLGGEGVSKERIDELLASEKQKTVSLHHPIMVVIAYATAVVDLDGTMNFYDDVYGRDAELEAKLGTRPPRTLPAATATATPTPTPTETATPTSTPELPEPASTP